MWRSPVAHSPGGRGVAGSNPVIPTEWRRQDYPFGNLCHPDSDFVLQVKGSFDKSRKSPFCVNRRQIFFDCLEKHFSGGTIVS